MLVDAGTAFLAAFFAARFIGQKEHTGHLYALRQHTPSSALFVRDIIWFGICLAFFSHSYGLYEPIQRRRGLHELRLTAQATFIAGLILSGSLYLTNGEEISRLVLLTTVVLTGIALCARRVVSRKAVYAWHREGIAVRNVMIVGKSPIGQALRYHLESLQHLGFRFKGFIALGSEEAELGELDVVADLHNCLPVARGLFVDEIFISVPGDRNQVLKLVEDARTYKIDVRVVPDLYDGLAWKTSVEYIGQFPTIPLHRKDFAVGSFVLKRVLDVFVSLVALILLTPILLIIAIAVYVDSGAPLLYRAERIGRKGRPFTCYKFRTMIVNADALKEQLKHLNERDGILFKMAADPRITRVGRILRKFSLDELPQLFNVLIGDMSLVGPRPPVASEVEKYDLSHLRRLDVLPGITGLWQVEARQDPSFENYIALDTAYVENWSLSLDLKILARTVSVVINGTGT